MKSNKFQLNSIDITSEMTKDNN